ncbi:MAG TPA: nucleotide exchange factor GrpE [Kofleriaceae bacterium]|jgi:molecular chaperone GrpE|nr:nucleotide exchange factor GrpE [Kofleriaceae bacterium]
MSETEKPEEPATADLPVEVEVEDPLAALEKRLAELEKDKQQTYDRLVRTAADLENFRKRSRRELDDARVDERFKVLREMLPVLDNLERAIEHAAQGDDGQGGVIQGVQLVLRQFAQALERCDVVTFEAAGQPFDPNLHEAIAQTETDELPPGTVVKVLQRGYKAGSGRLLRPAMVVVARPRAEEPAPSGNGADHGNGSDPAPAEGEGGEG